MTKYDLFRRRIAPIAFALAIGLIAYDTCNKQERTHATVVIDYGVYQSDVKSIDVELWSDGGQMVQFHRAAMPGQTIGSTQFKALMPSQDGELRIDVELSSGHRVFKRRIHTEEGATVRVPIEKGAER